MIEHGCASRLWTKVRAAGTYDGYEKVDEDLALERVARIENDGGQKTCMWIGMVD